MLTLAHINRLMLAYLLASIAGRGLLVVTLSVSEGSPRTRGEILRYAQNDRVVAATPLLVGSVQQD